MLVAIPTQIRGFVEKQKKIVKSAKTPEERSEAFGFWCGFLNGMRMTGVISMEEYKKLYREMMIFSKQKVA